MRIILGGAFIYSSYKALRAVSGPKVKTVAVIEGLAGILVFIGFLTQLGAIVLGIDLIVRLILKATKKQFLTDGVNYYLVLLVISFALLVYGAGVIGFDISL